MKFHVMTLFPDMIREGLSYSIIGRAVANGHIDLQVVNIRDFTEDKHLHVDDAPYGGGAGMVMQAAPIYRAYESIAGQLPKRPRMIYLTPQGEVFTQEKAKELAAESDLIFLCGHYEGVDERVLEQTVTDYLSIGDYVLTGGELPAMVLIDCIARLVPGVLNNQDSSVDESFGDGLLEYPQYTRPEEFMGQKVPEVLLSGHHGRVAQWRREQSLLRTAKRRPDLLKTANLSEKDKEYLRKNDLPTGE